MTYKIKIKSITISNNVNMTDWKKKMNRTNIREMTYKMKH